jgi:hypothetical protein
LAEFLIAVISDASPDPIEAREQYAQNIEVDDLANLDPRVQATNFVLIRILNVVAQTVPARSPRLYGLALHYVFAHAVKTAGLPRIGSEDVEQSFSAGDIVNYGSDGSVRTDVTLWDETHTNILAIFDLKTGRAKLTDARIAQLRKATEAGDGIPIIELRVNPS